MKSRLSYTYEQAGKIRKLLKLRQRAMPAEQKTILAHIRRLGFYISDFETSQTGFGPADFDRLIRDAVIQAQKPKTEPMAGSSGSLDGSCL